MARSLCVCVSLCLLAPVLWAQNPDYVLTATDATGPAGSTAGIGIILDFADGEALAGWAVGMCQDNTNAVVQAGSIDNGSAVAPLTPDFFSVQCSGPDGWAVGVVIDFFGVIQLLPGDGLEIVVATYDLQMDGETNLDFCDTLCAPAVSTVLVGENGNSIEPVTNNGLLIIGGSTGPELIRGDADGDGAFNALIDALFVLAFQFIGGSPAPPCDDAADFDDDGVVNGLVDGLGMLSFGFVMGTDPPPPPFPDCGLDPTEADPLGCDIVACP